MEHVNHRDANSRSGCRHEKYGYCSHFFWRVMKESGKPGLMPHQCRLWRAKLEDLESYHQAAWRADRFGLAGKQREKAMTGIHRPKPNRETSCPDYRPQLDGESTQCRYFFLETCLLTFPRCLGRCDDFLPPGDQTS